MKNLNTNIVTKIAKSNCNNKSRIALLPVLSFLSMALVPSSYADDYPSSISGDLYVYFATLSSSTQDTSNQFSNPATIPAQQQSFTTTSTIHFNSVDIKFFTDKSCLTAPTTVTLTGNYDAPASTYYTTPKSLYYLCSAVQPGGYNCNTIASHYLSIQYVYNFNNPESGAAISNTTACMVNTSIADYIHDASGSTACTEAACSFADNYNTFNITNNLMSYNTSLVTNGNILRAGQRACSDQAESVCLSSNITTGIMGADYLCNIDESMPTINQAYYKAMIVDGSNRIACTRANCSGGLAEHVNWVLYPKTKYQTTIANPAFTTNEFGIYNFTTQGDFSSAIFNVSASTRYWSDLDVDWTSRSALRCSAWAGSGSANGGRGNPSATTSAFLSSSSSLCSSSLPLLCVQQ